MLSSLSLSIQNLPLSADLIERLPPSLQKMPREFKPAGPVSLTYEFKRGDAFWSKRFVVKPEGMSAEYNDFPYPLKGMRGTLETDTNSFGAGEGNHQSHRHGIGPTDRH